MKEVKSRVGHPCRMALTGLTITTLVLTSVVLPVKAVDTEPKVLPVRATAALSEEAQKDHYKQFQDPATGNNRSIQDLNEQLYFISWDDPNATITGLGEDVRSDNGQYQGKELIVGSTWQKEITPGYVVTVRVKDLKNVAGGPNGIALKKDGDKYNRVKDAGGDPDVMYNSKVVAYQENFNGYSAALRYGFHAPGLSSVTGQIQNKGFGQPTGEMINLGVTFSISATYKGKTVQPTFFALSAEEAGQKEVEKYVTNGKGWELVTELMNSNVKSSYLSVGKVSRRPGYASQGIRTVINELYSAASWTPEEREGIKKAEMDALVNAVSNQKITDESISVVEPGNPDYFAADGLGTQAFGPVANNMNSRSTPIIATRGATEVSAYLISAGAQALTLGVMAVDDGDAPLSYGSAVHVLGQGRDGNVKHPYLGSTPADIDEKTFVIKDWNKDDETDDADEGVDQLMGDKVKPNHNYTLHYANDKTYRLDIQADPNGNAQSYVKGWIDFNNNGKFDEEEASELLTVNSKGYYELSFPNVPQNVATDVTRLGMRIRTALSKEDIANPTGYAMTGEVEDFQIQQVIAPRGERQEQTGKQGQTQTQIVRFQAYGQLDYDLGKNASIAIDENAAPQMVKKDGSLVTAAELDAEGYYAVPGQGKYKLTGEGKDVKVEFVPEEDFVGEADGISIRRIDTNGRSTGWGFNGNPVVGGTLTLTSTPTETMDGYFQPTVTASDVKGSEESSKGLQGAKQSRTVSFTISDKTDAQGNPVKAEPSASQPVRLIDPMTGAPTNENRVDVYDAADTEHKNPIGTYTVDPQTGEVTFSPKASYVGTAAPAHLIMMAQVGKDKDGQPVLVESRATYTPKVIGVKLESRDDTGESIQGDENRGYPFFDAHPQEVTQEEISFVKLRLIDPDTNQPTDATEVNAYADDDKNHTSPIGKYRVNEYFVVSFQPVASYVTKEDHSNATHIEVEAETNTGLTKRATYTPVVNPLHPVLDRLESEDWQGAKQSKIFTPSIETLYGEASLSAPKFRFADGTTIPKQVAGEGTYEINPSTGEIFFSPEASYTGRTKGQEVELIYTLTAGDGSKADLTAKNIYIPTVKPLSVALEPIESKGMQGEKQSQQFSAKLSSLPQGVRLIKTSYRFADGTTEPKLITGEGRYELDAKTGRVTFSPEPHFTGVARGVDVTLVCTIMAADKSQAELTATNHYTPTVVPVKLVPSIAPKTNDIGLLASIGAMGASLMVLLGLALLRRKKLQ